MKRIIISLLILVLLPAFAVAQEKKYAKTDSQGAGVSFKEFSEDIVSFEEFSEDIWYLAVAFRDEEDASKVTIRPIIAGRTVDAIQIPPKNIDKIRRVSVIGGGRFELVEIQMTGKLSLDLETVLMAQEPVPPEELAIYRDEQQYTRAYIYKKPPIMATAKGRIYCSKCRFFQKFCCYEDTGICKWVSCDEIWETHRQFR